MCIAYGVLSQSGACAQHDATKLHDTGQRGKSHSSVRRARSELLGKQKDVPKDARPVLHGTGGPDIVGGHLLRVLLMHWHLQHLGGVGHAVRCGHVCVALQVGDDLLQCVGVVLWQRPLRLSRGQESVHGALHGYGGVDGHVG